MQKGSSPEVEELPFAGPRFDVQVYLEPYPTGLPREGVRGVHAQSDRSSSSWMVTASGVPSRGSSIVTFFSISWLAR